MFLPTKTQKKFSLSQRQKPRYGLDALAKRPTLGQQSLPFNVLKRRRDQAKYHQSIIERR
jgi:hypothetical protein